MSGSQLRFIHRFVPGTRAGAVPLLLLHGTGGNEDDLLSLGRALAPDAPLLSPRGQVLENGMPRFFRRFAEGVFDVEDIRVRAGQLARFVEEARAAYNLGDVAPLVVGFSNGANIGAALLLLHPRSLSGALLLRPMVPLVPDPLPQLHGIRVLIAAGRRDPIVTPEQSQALGDLLVQAGADVSIHWSEGGHNLTPGDLEAGKRWMAAVSIVS
jgi:predicted esterase